MRLAAVLLAALLGGCAAAPEPPTSPVAEARHDLGAPCPPGAWTSGDWWNYTELDAEGTAIGYALRWVACGVHDPPYAVIERRARYGEPERAPEGTTQRNLAYEAPVPDPSPGPSFVLRASGPWPIPTRGTTEKQPLFAREEACVDPEADAPLADVAPLPAWQASPEGLMVRLSRALDDPLRGEPWTDGMGYLRWNTTSGSMETSLDHTAASPATTWRTDRDLLQLDDPQAWMRGLLDRFAGEQAKDLDVYSSHAPMGETIGYGRSVDGRPVLGVGGYVETAYRDLVFGPAYELPDHATVGEADAQRIAGTYLRCVLDRGGRTEHAGYAFVGFEERPPLAVQDATLAWRIPARYAEPGTPSHCGLALYAHVDARNGAVVGHGTPPCA